MSFFLKIVLLEVQHHKSWECGLVSQFFLKRMKIFATVGTTKFDDLLSILLSTQVFTQLKKLGYTSIIIQSGNSNLSFLTDSLRQQLQSILPFEIFNFAPSLSEYMKNADLIISHGGAGCLFESLSLKKKVIAVINETLMGNHQEELASVLEDNGFVVTIFFSNLSFYSAEH